MMNVTVLGSGSCIPVAHRGNAGYLLTVDGHPILLDGGSGALRQIARYGYDYRDIHHICYTHLHPDHTFDFVPLLFALRNDETITDTHPITVLAPVGFQDYWKKLEPIYHQWIKSDFIDLEIRELTPHETADLEFVNVATGPVHHSENSIAFRFTDLTDTHLVYSGDTGYSESFAKFATGADLLIVESAIPEASEYEKHSSPADAAQMAALAQAKVTMFTHFYPQVEHEDITGIARRFYQNRVILAEDGLTYTIKRNSDE